MNVPFETQIISSHLMNFTNTYPLLFIKWETIYLHMPHKLLDITKVMLPTFGAAVEGLDLPLGVPTKSSQSVGPSSSQWYCGANEWSWHCRSLSSGIPALSARHGVIVNTGEDVSVQNPVDCWFNSKTLLLITVFSIIVVQWSNSPP